MALLKATCAKLLGAQILTKQVVNGGLWNSMPAKFRARRDYAKKKVKHSSTAFTCIYRQITVLHLTFTCNFTFFPAHFTGERLHKQYEAGYREQEPAEQSTETPKIQTSRRSHRDEKKRRCEAIHFWESQKDRGDYTTRNSTHQGASDFVQIKTPSY